MLRRCLKTSGLVESAVRQTSWAGAWCQASQLYRAEASGEACWNSSSSTEHAAAANTTCTAALPPDVSKTLPEAQVYEGGLHAQVPFLPLGICGVVHSSLRSAVSQEPAAASSLYHRHYHETPASGQSRSFAKASRLVHPPSRAAKKLEERLPAARRSSDNVSETTSQPPMEGHESSQETDVITQAEESRASNVQVHATCCCHLYIHWFPAIITNSTWQHLHATWMLPSWTCTSMHF